MNRHITTLISLILAGIAFAQSPENSTASQTEATETKSEQSASSENSGKEINEEPASEAPTSVEESGEEEVSDAFHQQLQELEVKGESAWIEGNKFVFVPEKRVKRQARDIANMIQLLNTGILRVRDGNITTDTGQPVTIYINGVRADDIDQSTFWAMNALKVEFMPMTDDPRFSGSQNVLNIIMKEYVAGGVTKFQTFDYFPGSESLDASSKLVYRKMTYNAMVKGSHSYDHFTHTENLQTFEDAWYDGKHYGLIEKAEDTRSKTKSSSIYGGINARYRNDKWTITHTASLQWNNDPGSSTFGSLAFTPDIISGNQAWSGTSSRSLSPSVVGEYVFNPGGPWSFMGIWSFIHNHNRYQTENLEGDTDLISNSSLENVYQGGVLLYAGRSFGSKHSLHFHLKGNTRSSKMDYTGNTDSRQKVETTSESLIVGWYFKPNQKFYISLLGTGTLQQRKVNDLYSTTQFLPSGQIYSAYTFNRRNTLNLEASANTQSPRSNAVNDLILRQTELTWIEGNPFTKSSLRGSVGLRYYSHPVDWLNSELYCGWHASGKTSVLEYRSGGREYDGVIARYGNAHTQTNLSAFWRPAFQLFDGKFKIEPAVWYENYRVRNLNTVNNITYSIAFQYSFGDFYADMFIGTPRKRLVNGGREIVREEYDANMSINYGNGNLHAGLDLYSPLRKYSKTTSTFVSGPYTNQTISWQRAMKVRLFLSYTFDYGKKVDPSINIQATDNSSTSVLGR